MTLFETAIAGIDKQIRGLKSAIKGLEKEKKDIMENAGIETEHPLRLIIKKYPRVAKLKPPTDEQCQTLIDLYGEKRVIEKIEEMNNWKQITNKIYFYSTISSWFRKETSKVADGRVIKDTEYRKVIDKAKKESAGQPEIKAGWLTQG